MPSILKVKNLSKTYKDNQAVKDVSFEVNEGEAFGILGPNGAGKTTTLEMLEALRPIDGGTAELDGVMSPKAHKRLSASSAFSCRLLISTTD